jgi:hypothetical protein
MGLLIWRLSLKILVFGGGLRLPPEPSLTFIRLLMPMLGPLNGTKSMVANGPVMITASIKRQAAVLESGLLKTGAM